MNEHVRVRTADRILEIELCRPEKRNAITTAMYSAMTAALEGAARDPDVRVLLSGGQTFTAGNDLNDFLANPPSDENAPVLQFLNAITTFEKPLVAAVAGQATGIGTTMLLHCDVVLAAPDARLHVPFAALGLVPEGGSSLLLPLLMGHVRAARLLMLGEPAGAEEAAQLGLVTDVVAADDLLPRAREYAARLAAQPPAALVETKRLMRLGVSRLLREQMIAEVASFRERLRSAEAREAFSAFLEKRPPKFENGPPQSGEPLSSKTGR